MIPLVPELASGIVRADGTPADSCTAGLYQPGTLVAMTGTYAGDGTTPVTSPVTLDAAGRAFIRCASPFRLQVKDETNAVIFDQDVNIERSDAVRVASTYFNGGTETTLKAVLDAAGVGIGKDWKIQAGASSVGLTVKNWANGVHVDVTGEDIGGGNPVVGDGLVDCTAGIQAAINLVASLGGGIVYFPPGTYKTTSTLTVASNYVTLAGSGWNSVINCTAAASNAISIAALSTGTVIQSLKVTGVSSAACIYDAGIGTTIDRTCASGSTFCVDASSSTYLRITRSEFYPSVIAGGRAIRLTTSSDVSISSSQLIGGGPASHDTALEVLGTSQRVLVVGCGISGGSDTSGVGVSFAAGYGLALIGCSITGTDQISVGTGTGLQTVGCVGVNLTDNTLRGYSVDVTSGGSHTPDLTMGRVVNIKGTTNGAAWTVAAPTPAPGALDLDAQFVLVLKNDVAATGWTMNAAYHLSAAPSTVNGERTSYILRWNGTVWHDISRTVTT